MPHGRGRFMVRLFTVWMSALALGLPCRAEELRRPQMISADVVVVHARLWTVNRAQPEAEALAIIGDRIAAVGRNADVRPMTGPKTHVFDAAGRRVVPGFYDSHIHMLGS